MTPEAQQQAIAEYLGWTKLELYSGRHSLLYGVRPGDNSESQSRVPNYTEDLNACHEMEKALTIHDYAAYEIELCAVIDRSGRDPDIWHYVLTATAAEKAEAFLKAKGLWA